VPRGRRGAQFLSELRGQLAQFGTGEGAGDREPVAGQDCGEVGRLAVPEVEVAVPC
jgi:hypothetical protein